MLHALVVMSLWGLATDEPVPQQPSPPAAAPDGEDSDHSAWEPADAPPPTPWATAGARGWRLCHDAAEQARAAKRGGPRGGNGGTDDTLWSRRAEQCPHAPAVLSVAGQYEIVAANEVLAGVENWDADGEQLAEVAADHKRRMTRALGWLQASIDESGRRGEHPPPETYYYRAYALTTLGDYPAARKAVVAAAEHRDAAAHRVQRMAAVIELFSGNLERALSLAHRAVIGAPPDDQLISRFIYALTLDRAGALHSAAMEFAALQSQGGRYNARLAVESLLPVHERLFLRALDHQANDRQANAIRVWEFYLGRPEPEHAERVLARRHRDELQPRPELIEGPKR